MNKEHERVREEALRRTKHILDLPSDVYSLDQRTNKIVDCILPIKGIAILSDDQSLPKSWVNYSDAFEDKVLSAHYKQAQQDMLKAGFVKVVKEGEWRSK